jgi:hypothetical protein
MHRTPVPGVQQLPLAPRIRASEESRSPAQTAQTARTSGDITARKL